MANDSLRADLIHLFERTYAFLVGDVDRPMWAFQEAALVPITMQELTHVGEPGDSLGPLAPRNYHKTVGRGELRTMLIDHWTSMNIGTQYRQLALDETLAQAARIEALLAESGDE